MLKNKVKAQVALEFTAAFICVILFLLGTVQIFVWFGKNIVQRNKKYEETRKSAGTGDKTALKDVRDNFYSPEPLNIKFKK